MLPYAVPFWAVWVWAFLPEFRLMYRSRQARSGGASQDAGSLRVIAYVGMLASWLAFVVAFHRTGQLPRAWWPFAVAVGLAAVVAGGLLRRHCWRVLGEFFTGEVRVRADQPVVERGAYAWVRHPGYAAGILMNVGMGVAMASWLSATLLLAASAVVYGYRISVEERALVATIGEPYRAYMRRHKRLIPHVL